MKPIIHPCQKNYNDIKASDNDYIDLLNMIQRHTRCSTSYCLRKKGNEKEPKCRFNFPFQHNEKTSLQFELIHSKDNTPKYKIQVVTKRNDSRLNSHQRLQLQGWRANCDIQLVVDYQACVEYLTKYAAKSETRPHLLKNTFSAIVHNCQSTANATTMIKKTVMKTQGHHLLSLNFVSSSFIVFPVNLNGSHRLNLSDAPNEEVTTDSLLDTYAQRDKYQADLKCNLTNMNFLEFATKYKLVSGKLVAQPKNLIPRVFPTYSSSIKSPNFGLYCKYQLLRYRPWKTTPQDAWGNKQENNELFISWWKTFLQSEYAQNYVPGWHDKLQGLQEYSDSDLHTEEYTESEQREEWMILADFSISNNSSDPEASSLHNWQTASYPYIPQQIAEMPSWIISQKQTYIYQISNNPFNKININTFSDMQALAYYLVKEHFESPSQEPPLLLIINGFAGTGKSYLISALRSLLQQSCIVTATTGKASFNINGKTIHSVLNLPVGPRGNNDLKGQSLLRLQDGLRDVKYILIDEYSILGQTLLGWIDKSCRQATGLHDEIFGGKSIILVGDPAQLPPVTDKPSYHTKPTGPIGEQGNIAYLMFDKVVRLSVNQRVQGSSAMQLAFKNLLMRLRTGDSTEQVWQLLFSRQPSLVANLNEFDDAIKLFYGNDDVAAYNH